MEMGWKPNTELSPACPRCGSSNTKFCYYNNYSLTQPRYFCKGCRRYWTKGGSLRNVPVGGGCRKTRRGRSTRAAADAAASRNSSHPNRLHERPITCSSSTASTGIDLAAVYANFLNQPQPQPPPPPENRATTTLAELPDGIGIPPVEFSGLQMSQLSSYLPQENGFFECGSFLGGGGNNSTFFGGLTTSTTAAGGSGFGGMNVLPPLPGEEAAVWPSSEMLLHNQMLPLGQEIIGEEVQPAQQNLSGNINPFCGFNNLEAIFRS